MKYYTPTKLSENIRETPEGFLLCLGVPIARTGEMVYGEGETPLETDDEGKILIYRDADDVFHMDAIASFEGKAVTINHPEEFVNPGNWSYLAKGVCQNVRRGKGEESDCVVADLLITDALAISLVKNGLREVSCGYEAEYSQTGEGKGTQSGIVGNHIALVKQGRAGPSHAIKDHKGEGSTMSKLADKMKTLFAKAVDEAEAAQQKEEKKPAPKAEKSEDNSAIEELKQMLQALAEKINALGATEEKPMDEAKEEKKPAPKKEAPKAEKKEDKADDADEEQESEETAEPAFEERLKALETAVAKLLEKFEGDEESESDSEDEESEESEDDSDEESEESEDEEKEEKKPAEKTKTGDTAARAEILAPGIKATKGVDLKVKALEAAYQTKEGKEVIHMFTGGKKPVYDSVEKVTNLFIATSEILKASRGNGLEGTKNASYDPGDSKNEAMTAEKMNEANAAHWAKK